MHRRRAAISGPSLFSRYRAARRDSGAFYFNRFNSTPASYHHQNAGDAMQTNQESLNLATGLPAE